MTKSASHSIESVLKELRINFKVSGDEAIASCPGHQDRHPSWSCNLRTGVHHCFGCNYSGNLASLAELLLDLSYPEAVIWVNERAGWSRSHQWREDYQSTSFQPPEITEASLALFTDPPQKALEPKRITPEAAKKYEILWNPETGSWIFPVRNPYTNQLWGWQSKNDRTFRYYPVGLRRSETLFGLGAFRDGSTAVVVESPIDVAYLFSASISGGLATWGVQISDRQFSLVQHRASEIILALDNDIPGVDQTARACARDDKVRVFNYLADPRSKDVGEMWWADASYGVKESISSLKFLQALKNNKGLKAAIDVYRTTGRLPKTSKEPFYRPWESLMRI